MSRVCSKDDTNIGNYWVKNSFFYLKSSVVVVVVVAALGFISPPPAALAAALAAAAFAMLLGTDGVAEGEVDKSES